MLVIGISWRLRVLLTPPHQLAWVRAGKTCLHPYFLDGLLHRLRVAPSAGLGKRKQRRSKKLPISRRKGQFQLDLHWFPLDSWPSGPYSFSPVVIHPVHPLLWVCPHALKRGCTERRGHSGQFPSQKLPAHFRICIFTIEKEISNCRHLFCLGHVQVMI